MKRTSAICSVGQTAECFGNISDVIPTLTRSSDILSLTKDAMLTPSEHLTCMGLPIFGHLAQACGYRVPFQELIDSKAISAAQMKSLSGNGISLQVVGAVIGYVFANLCKRDSKIGEMEADHNTDDADSVNLGAISSSQGTDAQPWGRSSTML